MKSKRKKYFAEEDKRSIDCVYMNIYVCIRFKAREIHGKKKWRNSLREKSRNFSFAREREKQREFKKNIEKRVLSVGIPLRFWSHCANAGWWLERRQYYDRTWYVQERMWITNILIWFSIAIDDRRRWHVMIKTNKIETIPSHVKLFDDADTVTIHKNSDFNWMLQMSNVETLIIIVEIFKNKLFFVGIAFAHFSMTNANKIFFLSVLWSSVAAFKQTEK